MNKSVTAIIQARMGSSRLPGKTLEKIGDWTLIELVLKRVSKSTLVDNIILATSNHEQDDILAEKVKELNFPVFRGSEDDVLSRFYEASRKFQTDVVVRITGDCPLISPTLIDESIRNFFHDDVDYFSLSIGEDKSLAYPRGYDVEIAKFESLSFAANNAIKQYEREHVMPYLYTNPGQFSTSTLEPDKELSRPNYRLCVDTKEDLQLIRELYKNFGDQLIDVNYKEIIYFLDKNPELVNINRSVRQKHYTETC